MKIQKITRVIGTKTQKKVLEIPILKVVIKSVWFLRHRRQRKLRDKLQLLRDNFILGDKYF